MLARLPPVKLVAQVGEFLTNDKSGASEKRINGVLVVMVARSVGWREKMMMLGVMWCNMVSSKLTAKVDSDNGRIGVFARVDWLQAP